MLTYVKILLVYIMYSNNISLVHKPRHRRSMQYVNANPTNTTNVVGYRNAAVRRAIRRRVVINCCARN